MPSEAPLATRYSALSPLTTVALDSMLVTRQSNCSSFSLTAANWESVGVDAAYNSWWESTQNPSITQLATQFASQSSNFQCGINSLSTCTFQSCEDFESNPSHVWSYYVLNAAVNLNAFVNEVFTGVTNGQLDFVGIAGSVANDFFPWEEPTFLGNDFIIWIGAIVATAVSFGALGEETLAISSAAAGAFVLAAGQEVTLQLSPKLTPEQGTSVLEALATSTGQSTRAALENWVTTTFNGQMDVNGHTLKDYLFGGIFMQNQFPSNQAIETFFKQQLLARTINLGWHTSNEKVFIMAATASADDINGPNITKFYSVPDQKVYYLYSYVASGHLAGYLGKPPSFDKLNSTTYNINPADISKSSGRAWEYAKSNYTNEDVLDRIEASVASNGTLTPFQDGSGWEGVWTIPVCDVGSHVEWNTQFGDKKEGFGRLPCCCGPDCADTAEFVQAAGMKGFQTLLYGCKRQLRGTEVEFSSVDYGFRSSSFFAHKWAVWSAGQKAGVVIGFIAALFFVIAVLYCCFHSRFSGK